eukprot:SAG22_NODE_1390_length_4520_cov_1.529744_1_plen_152_part_00
MLHTNRFGALKPRGHVRSTVFTCPLVLPKVEKRAEHVVAELHGRPERKQLPPDRGLLDDVGLLQPAAPAHERTQRVVARWLRREVAGGVCAVAVDVRVRAVDQALRQRDRQDAVRVAVQRAQAGVTLLVGHARLGRGSCGIVTPPRRGTGR